MREIKIGSLILELNTQYVGKSIFNQSNKPNKTLVLKQLLVFFGSFPLGSLGLINGRNKSLTTCFSPLLFIEMFHDTKKQTLQFLVKIKHWQEGWINSLCEFGQYPSSRDRSMSQCASSFQDHLQSLLPPYRGSAWRLGSRKIHVQVQNQCLACCWKIKIFLL